MYKVLLMIIQHDQNIVSGKTFWLKHVAIWTGQWKSQLPKSWHWNPDETQSPTWLFYFFLLNIFEFKSSLSVLNYFRCQLFSENIKYLIFGLALHHFSNRVSEIPYFILCSVRSLWDTSSTDAQIGLRCSRPEMKASENPGLQKVVQLALFRDEM